MTALGAATIFLIRKEMKQGMQSAFLGFAAGVMIAASVWSLLIPSMEQAKELGMPEWLPAGGGFVLGGLFLLALDKALPLCIREVMSRKGRELIKENNNAGVCSYAS